MYLPPLYDLHVLFCHLSFSLSFINTVSLHTQFASIDLLSHYLKAIQVAAPISTHQSPSIIITMAPCNFVKLGALLTMFAAVGSASTCPEQGLWVGEEGKTSEQRITVGGEERSYLMHIAQGFTKHDSKVGFVFSFHGNLQNGNPHHQELLSSFSDPCLQQPMHCHLPASPKWHIASWKTE
jgi:hypothetical protein